MRSHSKHRSWWSRRARWAGLGLSTLVAAFWVFILILNIFLEGGGALEPESAMLTAMILLAVIAVILAWMRDKTGSYALLIVGVVFMAFAWFSAGHNKGFAMAISGGPFTLAGLML